MSDQSITPQQRAEYAKALHYTALFTVVAFPLVACLPPRKLDILIVGLVGGTAFSANYLHKERYGRSILQRIPGIGQRQVTILAPAHDERLNQPSLVRHSSENLGPNQKPWVAERRHEEEEAANEGKGIYDMMADQVKEVFVGQKNDD